MTSVPKGWQTWEGRERKFVSSIRKRRQSKKKKKKKEGKNRRRKERGHWY